MDEGSQSIVELVVARFLCVRNDDLTWKVSPKAVVWAKQLGVVVTEKFVFAPSDEWLRYKDLRRCEEMIHFNRDYFALAMKGLLESVPHEVERFTVRLVPDEYRILLVYAGQNVYDFFVRDHRFGAPPRGKVYRSNVRGNWSSPNAGRKRPDMAIFHLDRKINYQKSIGADVSELLKERERRVTAISLGEDPMAGRRKSFVLSKALTVDEEIKRMRTQIFGPEEEKELAPQVEHDTDSMFEPTAQPDTVDSQEPKAGEAPIQPQPEKAENW